jgi:hypothetical protein
MKTVESTEAVGGKRSREATKKMIVGAQLLNKDQSNADHADWTETRPAKPEHRHDCADGNHVTGGKRSETSAPVKIPLSVYLGTSPVRRGFLYYSGVFAPSVVAAIATGLWTWSWKWFWLMLVACSALTLLIQAFVYLLG